MQSNSIFEPNSLPQLPSPGFFEHRVLESPIPLAIACLAIGIVVFIALRHTKHAKRIGAPTLGLGVLLAGTIFMIGQLVMTDREHLKTSSERVVLAAATGDAQALGELLDERVQLRASFASQSGKERLITLSSTRAAPIIDSVSTREVRAGLYGPQVARTQIKVRVEGDLIPPMSWWTLDWTRPSPDSSEWVVTHIEPIWIQGISNPAGSD